MSKKTRILLFFLAVMAIAVLLRLSAIDSRSLWGDEVESVFKSFDLASSNYLFERCGLLKAVIYPITSVFSDGQKSPLYFMLLGVWIDLFGPGSMALRVLSVLIGIASVAMFFFFVRDIFDDDVAILSAFLLAISPWHLLYSQEIRMYGLLVLTGIASSWFFLRLNSGRESRGDIIGYVVSSILFAYTHYYALLLILAEIVIAVMKYFFGKSGGRFARVLRAQALISIVALLWPILAASRYLSWVLDAKARLAVPYMNFFERGAWLVFELFFGESIAPWNISVGIGAVALLVVAAGLIRSGSLKDERVRSILIMILLPVIISPFLRATLPKYIIFVLPLVIVIESYVILKFNSAFVKGILIFALSLVSLVGVVNYLGLSEMHNSNLLEPWREISAKVDRDMKAGDRVYVDLHFVGYQELNYYMNVIAGRNVPVYFVQDGLRGKRMFLVLSIHNESDRSATRAVFARAGYSLVSVGSWIPYSTTLAGNLPVKHHDTGLSRVEMFLCSKKE